MFNKPVNAEISGIQLHKAGNNLLSNTDFLRQINESEDPQEIEFAARLCAAARILIASGKKGDTENPAKVLEKLNEGFIISKE